jgi:hypothetical protein
VDGDTARSDASLGVRKVSGVRIIKDFTNSIGSLADADPDTKGRSARALRETVSRAVRATTAIGQSLRCFTALVSARLSRSQASRTTSSAPLTGPSGR